MQCFEAVPQRLSSRGPGGLVIQYAIHLWQGLLCLLRAHLLLSTSCIHTREALHVEVAVFRESSRSILWSHPAS